MVVTMYMSLNVSTNNCTLGQFTEFKKMPILLCKLIFKNFYIKFKYIRCALV